MRPWGLEAMMQKKWPSWFIHIHLLVQLLSSYLPSTSSLAWTPQGFPCLPPTSPTSMAEVLPFVTALVFITVGPRKLNIWSHQDLRDANNLHCPAVNKPGSFKNSMLIGKSRYIIRGLVHPQPQDMMVSAIFFSADPEPHGGSEICKDQK